MGESTTIAVDLAKSVIEESVPTADYTRHDGDDVSIETDAGIEPTTALALEAGASDWLPARGFHPGPAPTGRHREAEDTTAVLPSSETSRRATCGRSPDMNG